MSLPEDELTYVRQRLRIELREELGTWARQRFWWMAILVAMVSVIGVNAVVFPVVKAIVGEDVERLKIELRTEAQALKTEMNDAIIEARTTSKVATKSVEEAENRVKRATLEAVDAADKLKGISERINTFTAKAEEEIEKVSQQIASAQESQRNLTRISIRETDERLTSLEKVVSDISEQVGVVGEKGQPIQEQQAFVREETTKVIESANNKSTYTILVDRSIIYDIVPILNKLAYQVRYIHIPVNLRLQNPVGFTFLEKIGILNDLSNCEILVVANTSGIAEAAEASEELKTTLRGKVPCVVEAERPDNQILILNLHFPT